MIDSWTNILALIGALAGIIISLSRRGPEVRQIHASANKNEAETDLIHEEAATKAAERAQRAEERADRFATRVEQLSALVEDLQKRTAILELSDCEKSTTIAGLAQENVRLQERLAELELSDSEKAAVIAQMTIENAELRDLVTELTAQVAALGGDPIKPKRGHRKNE